MKLTLGKLFTLMVNTQVGKKVFDVDATFGEMVHVAENWTKPNELKVGERDKVQIIRVNDLGSIIRLPNGRLKVSAKWPIKTSPLIEEKDLLMTALVMMLWIIQPEDDEGEKANGKIGKGIMPFELDLEGLEKNIHKVEPQLSAWGIDLDVVKKTGRRFKTWVDR